MSRNARGRPATPGNVLHRRAGRRPSAGSARPAGLPAWQAGCPGAPRCPDPSDPARGSTRTPMPLAAPRAPRRGYRADSCRWRPDRPATARRPAAGPPAPCRSAAGGAVRGPCCAASARRRPRPSSCAVRQPPQKKLPTLSPRAQSASAAGSAGGSEVTRRSVTRRQARARYQRTHRRPALHALNAPETQTRTLRRPGRPGPDPRQARPGPSQAAHRTGHSERSHPGIPIRL